MAGEFTSPLSTGRPALNQHLHPRAHFPCLLHGPCLRPGLEETPQVGCVGTNCSKFCKGLWSLKALFLSLWVPQLAPLSLVGFFMCEEGVPFFPPWTAGLEEVFLGQVGLRSWAHSDHFPSFCRSAPRSLQAVRALASSLDWQAQVLLVAWLWLVSNGM